MKNPDVLNVARNIMKRYYQDAAVGFAAGSVFRNEGSEFSDIDLVVLYDDLFDDVRRETIEAEGWPVEIFIHNVQAQNYFMHKDAEEGQPILISMICEGKEIPGPCDLSRQQKRLAAYLLAQGAPPWPAEKIEMKRYFISDLLDDLRGVAKPDERYAILGKLYADLADFHLRAQGKWSGSGKSLLRAMNRQSPRIAARYVQAFDSAFRHGDSKAVIVMADEILQSYGGRLLHFKQKAGPEWRRFELPQGSISQNFKPRPA